MGNTIRQTLPTRIREHAYPIRGEPGDFQPLLAQIGDARFVLIGEASHGTHEFYETRAAITRRLIEEKGFTAVAVEADWPDAYRVNRYVHSGGSSETPEEALSDFKRFPTWMWRNQVVLDFVSWLHDHNQNLPANAVQCSFYGLDLYSLYASAEAVLDYLDRVDPQAAQRARYRYACFEHFGEDPQAYGYAASFNLAPSCESEVVQQLIDLRNKAYDYLHRDGFVAQDEFFFAEQNTRVVQNAEEYYRSMFQGRVASWNLRDRHMAQTLEALANHFENQGRPAKIVVWEHNSHLGDGRATEMSKRGEVNVGQLVRQRFGSQAILIGFTTHSGTVTAASDWGAPALLRRVRPSLAGSFEQLFHSTELPRFTLMLSGMEESLSDLRQTRLERAIGVIYRPETERLSHYFNAQLMDQFDAVLHFDETRAVEPSDRNPEWEQGEPPETFPSGL